MQGMHVDLRVRCENLSEDEGFDVVVRLESRVLAGGREVRGTVRAGGVLEDDVAVPLREVDPGSVTFVVEVVVGTSDGVGHRFSGKFRERVFAKGESPANIAVHLNQSVNVAMGGLAADNKVELALPTGDGDLKVNDLLRQQEIEHGVELAYEGEVGAGEAEAVGLVDPSSGKRWEILTGASITLGRGDEARGLRPDALTWFLPRSVEHDARSRAISGMQCRLKREGAGLVVEQMSRSNPTKVDGVEVRGSAALALDRGSVLMLPQGFEIALTPVVGVGGGVGALRMERGASAGGRGGFVWLMGAVGVAEALGLGGGGGSGGVVLAESDGRVLWRPAGAGGRGMALRAGGGVDAEGVRLRVVGREGG